MQKLDFSFNTNDYSVRYACFAIYKQADKDGNDRADMVYAFYTLESTPPRELVPISQETYRSKLGFYTEEEPKLEAKTTITEDFERLKAEKDRNEYFRFKVVDGFAAEGLVDRNQLRKINAIVSKEKQEINQAALDVVPVTRTYDNSLEMIQEALCSMEWNETAYSRFNAKIKKHTEGSWTENVEVRKHFDIENFLLFLEELNEVLGMDEKDYLDMVCNYKYVRRGEVNKVEVQYKDGEMDVRYVIFAVYKHKNRNTTDLVYAIYSLKATAQTEQITAFERKKYFWGLVPIKGAQKTLSKPKDLAEFESLKADTDRDHYFRYKVLDEFASCGLVDREKFKKV